MAKKDAKFISTDVHVSSLMEVTRDQAIDLVTGAMVKKWGGRERFVASRWLFDSMQDNPDEMILRLDYPLDRAHDFPIFPDVQKFEPSQWDSDDEGSVINWWYVGGVLWDATNIYKNQIYADPERFGIWGHGMGDLVYEGIYLYEDEGIVELAIGS